jgi:hypothetical protein
MVPVERSQVFPTGKETGPLGEKKMAFGSELLKQEKHSSGSLGLSNWGLGNNGPEANSEQIFSQTNSSVLTAFVSVQ